MMADETKTGGPITKKLKYNDKDDKGKITEVGVTVPNMLEKMKANVKNSLGTFNFRNV